MEEHSTNTIFFVDSSMSLQSKPIGKGSCTDFTFERLFTAVHLSMVLQMSCLTECWTASFASTEQLKKKVKICTKIFHFSRKKVHQHVDQNSLVWFLSCVDTTMIPQGCMACKSFVAYFADVRFLPAVRTLMVFQMWRLRELHTTGLTSIASHRN